MWDGRIGSIARVDDATTPCSDLGELDLSSRTLDLRLCRVLRVWDYRSTRRMDGVMMARRGGGTAADEGEEEDSDNAAVESTEAPHPSVAMAPFGSLEDDGPLNVIYKKVFSIEICQIVDDDDDDGHEASFSNPATDAFRDRMGEASRRRKRRHAVRRIRVFFYNGYAEAMANAFLHLREQHPGKNTVVPFLMSLSNVPARCIVPHSIAPDGRHPHLQKYVLNPFGDEDFGVLSPYCICIGDKSSISYDPAYDCLSFECDELEIRLIETPAKRPLADNICTEDICFEDVVVTAKTIRKHDNGYVFKTSDLVKRYSRVQSRGSTPGPMLFNLEDEENADVAPNPEVSRLRGDATAKSTQAITKSSTTAGSRESVSDPALRPDSVTSLHSLRHLLLKNGTKRTVTVWAVVLGFTPPSLTSTREWKMSIVLIDETLQLSNSVCTTSDNGKPAEMHVPSVTLTLFSKDKSKLPIVRSAGDVVLCEKANLQAWNGEPQLTTKKNVSKLVIIRPRQPRCPGYPWPSSNTPDDWSVIGDQQCNIQYPFVKNIWFWGQQRLSQHPTMSPSCYLSIGGAGDSNSNIDASTSGDLTAAVTAIIPMPEHLRHRDTPRGEMDFSSLVLISDLCTPLVRISHHVLLLPLYDE